MADIDMAPRSAIDLLESLDSWAAVRNQVSALAGKVGEWAGIPLPIEGERLVLDPKHPHFDALTAILDRVQPQPPGDFESDDTFELRNHFRTNRGEIYIYLDKRTGKVTYGLAPGVHHISMDLRTMGNSVAWGIEQEARAVKLLSTLVRHHIFKSYMLTGMFLETSKRSGVTYIFRRLRPTVALSLKGKHGFRMLGETEHENSVHILACLCLHPLAYYAGTWAGAMTPTDDVIAHLMLMRGDEPMFWRRANQIAPWRPEASL